MLAPQGHPEVTLAAFTRLHTLTLHQATDAHGFSLRAADLPASLEDLRVFRDPDEHLSAFTMEPPLLNGFDTLLNLRLLTLDHCPAYTLATELITANIEAETQFKAAREVKRVFNGRGGRGGRGAGEATSALTAELTGMHGVIRQHASTWLLCKSGFCARHMHEMLRPCQS